MGDQPCPRLFILGIIPVGFFNFRKIVEIKIIKHEAKVNSTKWG